MDMKISPGLDEFGAKGLGAVSDLIRTGGGIGSSQV
jgi:hypothetical protein